MHLTIITLSKFYHIILDMQCICLKNTNGMQHFSDALAIVRMQDHKTTGTLVHSMNNHDANPNNIDRSKSGGYQQTGAGPGKDPRTV